MANQDLVRLLRDSANARRNIALEDIAERESAKRRPGQYSATWQGYDSSGDGKVLYQGRIYKARIIADTSIHLNAPVKLTVTDTEFFVDW